MAGSEQGLDARAYRKPKRLHAVDGGGDASSIPHFKGPHLPVEAGAHGAVDGSRVAGDFSDAVRGIVPQRGEKRPEEGRGLVLCGVVFQQQAQPLGDRGGIFSHFQSGQGGLADRAILPGAEVERHAYWLFFVFGAVVAAEFLVEALAGFVAKPAAADHLFQNAGKAALRDAFWEVGGHMGRNVDAHHVGKAEGTGAGPADGLSGERVHLFDGELLLQHQRSRGEHDRDADAVGDEIGGVVGEYHELAQIAVGEGGKGGQHCRIGFGGGNDLEEAHVARRIEKMSSEEAVAMRGEPGCDLLERQAGGVGGEQGVRCQMRHDAGQERRFYLQVFGHGLDDPIASSEPGQVVLEVAGGDERGERRLVEGSRFGLGQGGERGFRQAVLIALAGWNEIEEERGDACVRQVRGDAGAHGTGAQDGGAADEKRRSDNRKRTGRAGSGSYRRGSRTHAGSPLGVGVQEPSAMRKPSQDTELRGTRSRMKAAFCRTKVSRLRSGLQKRAQAFHIFYYNPARVHI